MQFRSSSLPPRPPTRRSVFDMPEDVEVNVIINHYTYYILAKSNLFALLKLKAPVRSAPRSQSQTSQRLSKTEKRIKNQNFQNQLADKPIVIKDPVRIFCFLLLFLLNCVLWQVVTVKTEVKTHSARQHVTESQPVKTPSKEPPIPAPRKQKPAVIVEKSMPETVPLLRF